MKLSNAVNYINSRFIYKKDKFLVFDHWSVMKNDSDTMTGDCDDYATTVIWYSCDRNILKFIFYVIILHRYKFWFAKTKTGEGHLVGSYKGLYFDNWTKTALVKEDFLKATKHNLKFFFPSPFIIIQLLIGAVTRYFK